MRILPAEITRMLGVPAVGSAGLRVANAGFALLTSVLLARLLGPSGYGVYAFAFSVVMLLALPTQAGLPTLLVREVARYEEQGRWDLIRGLLRRSNQAVVLLAFGVGGVAAVVVLLAGPGPGSLQATTFLWALTLLPLMALGNLRGAALRGLRRVVQGQLPEFLVRPGLLLLALAVALLLGPSLSSPFELTPPLAMALHAASALVAFAVGIWLLRRELPSTVRGAAPAYETRAWLGSLLPLTMLAGMQLIAGQMDVVLLGLLASAREVGIYRVAWSVSLPVLFTLTGVNLVVAPYFSRAFAAGDVAQLQRLATWSARVAAAVAVPAALVLMLAGGPILGFVFGDEFAVGATALALLAAGQLCSVIAGSVGTILNMTGHERDTMVGVGIAAAVNLILNLILIPKFGMNGAAVATMVSLVIWNSVLVLRVGTRLGIASVAWHPSRLDETE
jgi:O-antigen/teichoic acid export membrane protein